MSGLEVLLGLGIATNAMWLIQNAKIVIFGKDGCKWCKKLKRYISKLGNEYSFKEGDVVEVDIDKIKSGMEMFEQVRGMTGNDTVPQVFVDETYVGGYPEFKDMYRRKDIQKMLGPIMAEEKSPHCKNCNQDREKEKLEKKKKMDKLLKNFEDDLLFTNNAIAIPTVAR